jgi:VWFA-related protein
MRKAAVTLLAAAIVIPLGARQPLPQPPAPFRATTDIVEIDVVVQDRKGFFVTDLTSADFEVREEGNPQKIDLFYLAERDGRMANGVGGGPSGRAGPAPATLRDGSASATPRVFVALFDNEHLTPGGFKRVQTAALTLFSKQFQDGDVGGVVRDGRMANNRLTMSREELLKAVRDTRPGSKSSSRVFDQRQWPSLTDVEAVRIAVQKDEAARGQAVQRACADEPALCPNADLAVRGKAAQLMEEARAATTRTVRSLLALLNGLSRMEGRKTVLLLSEGFIADESWPLVNDAVGAAARANARIYTLDARGLERYGMSDRLSGQDPGTNDALNRLLRQLDMGSDSINSLAIDTGGFAVRDTNNFDEALSQIAADASTFYLLGYRSEAAPDGMFRRLSVKVNRPGVIVRARRGYVASVKQASIATPAAAAPASTPPDIDRPEPASSPTTARPEPEDSIAVSRSTAESTATAPAVRRRPNVEEHIETLGPEAAGDADADSGWEAYKRGDVESARRALSVAAARPAAAPWVFYALGQSDYAMARHQDAVSSWEKVRTTNPEFEPVYFDLVDGYLQLKDFDRAIRVMRAAKDRWPRDPDVFNALGVVQVARSALDDAVGSFQQAIASAPAEGTGYFNLGKTLELRYWQSRRYVRQLGRWVANERDRTAALDNYQRYLKIGGQFEASARDGVARLGWTTP